MTESQFRYIFEFDLLLICDRSLFVKIIVLYTFLNIHKYKNILKKKPVTEAKIDSITYRISL